MTQAMKGGGGALHPSDPAPLVGWLVWRRGCWEVGSKGQHAGAGQGVGQAVVGSERQWQLVGMGQVCVGHGVMWRLQQERLAEAVWDGPGQGA